MRVKFHPAARQDLREGRTFYRRRSPVAGVAFTHAIDAAIARIVEAPGRYACGDYGTREYVLPRQFPYTVVYTVQGSDLIVIIAVAHHSKEPGFWHGRL